MYRAWCHRFMLAARWMTPVKVFHEWRQGETIAELASLPPAPFCSSSAYMMEGAWLDVEAVKNTDAKQFRYETIKAIHNNCLLLDEAA